MKITCSMKNNLQWQCRRGMKELDVVIERFLAEDYSNLDADMQECFHNLMQADDGDLFDWITGRRNHEEKQTALLIEIILKGNS